MSPVPDDAPKGMAMINAFDPGRAAGLGGRERAMVERRGRLLGPAYRLFYERPRPSPAGGGRLAL